MERNEIGKKIREVIEEAGLTQTELARRLGITQPSISSFIAEDSNPTYDTLKRIAKATGRSLNCFLDDSTGNNNAMDSDAVSGTNNVQIGAMSSKRDTEVELLKKDNELLKKDIENLKLKLEIEQLKNDKKDREN